jgi:hypothetical protein
VFDLALKHGNWIRGCPHFDTEHIVMTLVQLLSVLGRSWIISNYVDSCDSGAAAKTFVVEVESPKKYALIAYVGTAYDSKVVVLSATKDSVFTAAVVAGLQSSLGLC